MNCIIVEDQAPAQRILIRYIEEFAQLNLCGIFFTAHDAKLYLDTHDHIDIIFLDIHLPNVSGIDFLNTLENPPAVILTTAFTEYALQGYELNVVDYLVKPISYERFEIAIEKFIKKSASIFIKTGHEYIRILTRDIYHIQSDLDYTEIHLKDRKIVSNETLNSWEKKLESATFIRVHKSHIINSDQILKVAGNEIELLNNTTIPIGRAYKERFMLNYIR